jgi:hypothetical protein
MATRRKAKGKATGKRKKAPVTKATTRRKATRKAKTTSKKTAKKVSSRSVSIKETEPIAKTTVKAAPQSASRERIGVVIHYYSHLSVATMRLDPGTTLQVGDVIHIHGHTTDFTQKVDSLEVNHAPVTEVGPNDDFGLKVIDHAREHDAVFRVRS